MHLRRAVILFAVVLGIAAVAASLAPRRGGQAGTSEVLRSPGGTATTPPPPTPAPSAAVTMPLGAAAARRPPVETVKPGSHLVLTVTVDEPGQVTFLGGQAAAEPGTPATFDVLAPESSRLPVTFAPAAGGPERRGTIVVGTSGRSARRR